MKIIINWLIFLGIIAAFWFRHWLSQFMPTLPAMSGPQIVLFAFSCAFTWVEVLRWGSVKPFNCVKCLTGWFAVILAFMFHVEHWYFYLPVGLAAGAVWEGVKMRYL